MQSYCRTIRNFNTARAGLTVTQALGPNPYRKALVLSPVVGSGSTNAPIGAAAFAKGLSQHWTVPTGVTQIINVLIWGAGGNPGVAGAALGGGGGGGGGFSTTGPITVVPGQVWQLDVDAPGGVGQSTWYDQALAQQSAAGSGGNGLLDAAGTAGPAGVGVVAVAGGAGAAATALAGVGGGGGGSGGYATAGGAAAGATGGTAGGTATYGVYGPGAAGSAGGAIGVVADRGGSPGAGGGGSGKTAGAGSGGADGAIIVLYSLPTAQQGLSFDQDPGLILGQGAFNWLANHAYQQVLTDREIGSCIMDPWYIISGIANTLVRITEYSYVTEEG